MGDFQGRPATPGTPEKNADTGEVVTHGTVEGGLHPNRELHHGCGV